MKNKFVYHVALVLQDGRSSWDFYLKSLRLARVQVRNFKKVIPHLIVNRDLRKGDEYDIFIIRYSNDDYDHIYPEYIYCLSKVVK